MSNPQDALEIELNAILSEEELDNIAGGATFYDIKYVTTTSSGPGQVSKQEGIMKGVPADKLEKVLERLKKRGITNPEVSKPYDR